MIGNIVFDLGGVIIELDRDKAVKAFQKIGVKNTDSLLDKYHQQGIFQEVEDGSLDADGFCRELGKLCGKNLTFEDAQKGWRGFVNEIPQYKLDYMNELRRKAKCIF